MGTRERRAVNGVRRASAPSGKFDEPRAPDARGLFVVLEGIDGSGKTLQAKRLSGWLASLGHEVVATREPTQGEWGLRYRSWARGETEATADEVLTFFVEDRREHVRDLILPALERGAIVVCDRYTGSTLAYQAADGVARDLLRERVELDRLPVPDLVLWLRLSPDRALGRLTRAIRERYEGDAFLRRVDAEYARLGFVEVDASQDPDRVERALRSRIENLLAEQGR